MSEYDTQGLMRWSEIARRLGVSIHTVQRDYLHALDKIRDKLYAEGITEEEFAAYLQMRASNPVVSVAREPES